MVQHQAGACTPAEHAAIELGQTKGETYEGRHPPIIDSETWDAVQARRAANTHKRLSGTNMTERSLLVGKLFDEDGGRLTPSHAVKSGRRYRYYVSRDRIAESAERSDERRNGWRLPAREIERLVGDGVTALLEDRAELTRLARDAEIDTERVPDLLHAVRGWTGAPLDLVKRVVLGEEETAVSVDLSHFLGDEIAPVRHVIRARIKRRGVEMRLILDDGLNRGTARPDPALIKAVARARGWFDDLVTGRARSYDEIAKREGVTRRYVGRLMLLAFLAPDIVAAIVGGTQPIDLTVETITKRTELPLDWAEQRSILRLDRRLDLH